MIRKVLRYPEDKRVLRSISREVQRDDDWRDVARDLIDTLKDNPRGIGLAAPQIGALLRMFAVRLGPSVRVFVNPVVLQTSAEMDNAFEGCLSMPGARALVRRASAIRIASQEPGSPRQEFDAREFSARVIQHEMDHLDGIVMTMREGK